MTHSDSSFWTEVENIFDAVASMEEPERTQALRELSSGRPAIEEEVRSLLAAHGRAGGFLHEADPRIGTQVGPFRILELIGRGGMGEIFRAERTGGDFQQQVAVKLIAARVTGEEAQRRFRTERRILAALQHPNIVALLDGGVTESDQPYLVMEYVQGVHITEFCLPHPIPMNERLALFRQLCAAVDFAHRHLIVHRDLKPANVLVTDESVVKVLDFGIAKLLDEDGHAPAATAPLMTPMTPNYASPEQLRGAPVTTAADVYALGVMLYELISGVQPYETAGKPLDEVLELVVTRDPPRPGSHARVPRELETIVMRAMAKDPAERYASAAELSDDIGRFLAGAPIVAAGTSFGYLLRKTIARQRTAFGIGAVSIVLLVGALIVAMTSARIATRERERAMSRFHDVRELAGALVFRIHDEVAPLPGSTPVRQTIVGEGLKFLEKLERDADEDPALQIELANAYVRMGDVQGGTNSANLGDREGARRSYEKAVRLASAAQTRSPEALIGAYLALSNVLDRPANMEAVHKAHSLASDWYARDSSDLLRLELLARSSFFLALRTKPSSADKWLEVDRLYKRLLAADPDNPSRSRSVALTQKYLATHYLTVREYDRSLEHGRNALALDRSRIDNNPNDAPALMDVAFDLGIIADSHQRHGRPGEAVPAYRESLEIRERVYRADPENVHARSRVAYAHAVLAIASADAGEAAAVVHEHAARAIDLSSDLTELGDGHRIDRAVAFVGMARADQMLGETGSACAWYAQARDSYTGIHADLLTAYGFLTGRIDAALAECRASTVASSAR